MRHLVRTIHGVCEVTLERGGLDLGERGGFSARWADPTPETAPLGLETYRRVVKAYLAELYRERHGHEAGSVTLNLASHQLVDDLTGWTKLNARPGR